MEPELKIYTISDLRSWLIDNNPPVGLTEHVIAPVRAYAILNNPYVKDEDAVVAVIYESNELAAFTASFPDLYEGKRIWWASTLWCNPKFQGQGYGMIVVGSLMDEHEPELTFDRWGARETVEIFNYLGYKTNYSNRYIFGERSIKCDTFKGKIAHWVQVSRNALHYNKESHQHYSLRYSTFVDGEAYVFMQNHKGSDLFLREQRMFNWIMRFPFMQECTLIGKVEKDSVFSSNIDSCQYMVVKVYTEGSLNGVFLLHENSGAVAVLSIYYKSSLKEIVFASIADHIVLMKAKSIEVENNQLVEYLKKNLYFPKITKEVISLSIPIGVKLPETYSMQLIDGDSFA